MVYQLVQIKPSRAVGDLQRLQNLATRVALRVYKGTKELPMILESVIPYLVTVKLEISIPTIIKNQLLAVKEKGKAVHLMNYSKLFGWKSFPYYLEFPNVYQNIIRDYSKISEDTELERYVSIRTLLIKAGAAAYYTALNPPPPQHQVNFVAPAKQQEKRKAFNKQKSFKP